MLPNPSVSDPGGKEKAVAQAKGATGMPRIRLPVIHTSSGWVSEAQSPGFKSGRGESNSRCPGPKPGDLPLAHTPWCPVLLSPCRASGGSGLSAVARAGIEPAVSTLRGWRDNRYSNEPERSPE